MISLLDRLIVIDNVIIIIISIIIVSDVMCSYPTDSQTHGIDEQFLWGYSLLVSPVLHEVLMFSINF